MFENKNLLCKISVLLSIVVFNIFVFAQDENIFVKLIDFKQNNDGYISKIEVDEENGLVFFKTYYNDHLLTTDSIKMLSEYIVGRNEGYVKELFKENAIKAFEGSASESGLIGDIDLPITFGKMTSFLGEGGKLIVEGSERVEYSGSKTFDLTGIEAESGASSLIPEFILYQHLIVSVTGTVGERIKVNLKHDSETEKESDNKVKLEYTGIDDDILQSIEAGDVDLSLPGIKLIGGTPQHKGLFGVKGSGQIGGLNFTAIASKQTGESETKQFIGNTKQDSLTLYDIEYVKNRFFFIGTSSSDSIILLYVFKDDGIGTNNEEQGAVPGRVMLYPGVNDSSMFEGTFALLMSGDNNDYYFEEKSGYIEFLSPLSSSEVLGISYIVKHSDGSIDTVGSIAYSDGDTLNLKAIKQKDDYPNSVTWNYMMKNIYSFNTKNIVSESFTLKIKKVNYASGEDYEIEGDKTYIKLLGLDNNEDGKVDLNFVNFERGYIVFPQLLPFADTVLNEPDSIIYTSQETGYIGRLYYLDISYKGSQSVYSLGVFNILEGSEVVKINGATLVKDKDYTIDYEFGIVNFLTDQANASNAEITIDYQYAPFLSLAAKNLLGLHLDYSLSDKLTSTSNWLYNTLSYQLDDYPTLGEEPQDALVGEADISYNDKYYSLTDFANLIPFYYSDQPTLFSITGKAGMSYPNPNSTGKAFIENMESVLAENGISIDRKSWLFGSNPTGFLPSDLSLDYRWYNGREILGNINELLPDADKDDDVSTMNIIMENSSGDPNVFVSLNQSISRTGIDLSDMTFIEVWVKGDQGFLSVEIGKNIPEDMLRRSADGVLLGPDNVIQTEDENNDGILDNNEDTGLDNINGTDGDGIEGDDGNDDYYYSAATPNDYTKINGTEDNNILDSEDLDRDGSLNMNSDLYKFTIALAGDENMVYKHPTTGWKLFRIPITSSSVAIEGNPDLKYIKYSRIYYYGTSKTDSIEIYQISAVSNKWKNYMTLNSIEEKFFIGAKNNQTDPDYDPPFDPGLDLSGKEKREQSMVLYCNNLLHGEGGRVYKILSAKNSYERYKQLSLYIKSTDSDSMDLYFKFGGDSLNYYYLKLNPKSGWDSITVDLDSLVNNKREHSDTNTFSDSIFGFYGAPSLTNISYVDFTVMNNSNTAITTEIWVDDIMLSEVKRESGYAGDISANFSLPSLLNLSMSGNFRDPFFRTINDDIGSGTTTTGYRFSSSFNFEKILPDAIGVSIPLSYSKNNSVNVPYYRVGTDYKMNSQEISENSTYSNSSSSGVSIRRSRKSANPFISYLIDNLSLSYSYSNGDNLSYNRTDSTNIHSVNGSYSINPSFKPIKLFNRMEFYPLPSQFSYSSGFNRSLSSAYIMGDSGFVKVGGTDYKTFSRSMNVSQKIFRSISLTYSESRSNDLSYPGSGRLDFLGLETGKNHNIGVQYNPSILKFITHSFSLTSAYAERNNPSLVVTGDSAHITDISNNGRFSASGNFDYPSIIKWVSLWRDEERDSLAIAGSPPWMGIYLEQFAKIFSPLSYSYSRTNASSFSYISGRAPLLFQVGLIDTIPLSMYSTSTQLRKSTSESYSLSSSANISNISLSSSYSHSVTLSGLSADVTKDLNERWPSLSLDVSGMENIVILNKAFRSLNLRSSYNKSMTQSGKVDSMPDRRTVTSDFLPVVGVSGSTNFNMNVSYNYNYTLSDRNNYGVIETENKSETFSHNLSLGYSFSSPSGINIPLLNKRVKFKSNLNTSIDFTLSKTIETDVTNENRLEDRVMYDIRPKADYNFSNNVNGGLNIGFSRSEDYKRGDKRQTISAGFWVLFRF